MNLRSTCYFGSWEGSSEHSYSLYKHFLSEQMALIPFHERTFPIKDTVTVTETIT